MELLENLTTEQRKTWEKTLKELNALYEKLHLTANPMPADKIRAIRIPKTIAEEGSVPLPWDAQLLLSFDQDLTLAPDDNEFPLLGEASKGALFTVDVLLDVINEISGEDVDPRRARKLFLEQAGELPVLIDLPQLGGDELPILWPVLSGDQCSVVLHFDTDESAEFYVRSTSLFSYVLQYLDSAADMPEYVEDTRTDLPKLWGEQKDRIILDRVESKLELLNDSLYAMLESMSAGSDPLYDEDDDDDGDDDSFDDEDDDDYYSDDEDDYSQDYDDENEEDYDDYEDDDE